ncbi:MAG: hypothetical protein JST01_23710 [Cyanobacteria bacterium SZAS TMP-1]|nr:hypothetical protein [Cyanobacteria bacterium SZAS TMP-1]
MSQIEKLNERGRPGPGAGDYPACFRALRYTASEGFPVMSGGTARVSDVAVKRLLDLDEKLLSFGYLPRSYYFALSEAFLVQLMILLFFTHYWLLSVFLPLSLLLSLFSIKRTAYALTDRRLIRFGQYTATFDLAQFERADFHRGAGGESFLEFWRAGADGPSVVLELVEGVDEVAVQPLLSQLNRKSPLTLGPD